MADAAKRAFDQFPKFSDEQLRIFAELGRIELRQRILRRIGFLPHKSTPFDLLDEQLSDDELKARIKQHYTDNWNEISQGIRDRAQTFDIDDEAKLAFAEALDAHQIGHYRSVCRLLLPEIERVARIQLQGNAFGAIRIDKVLGEPALSLSIGDTNPPGLYALDLYNRLTDHLYVHVDATNRDRFEKDPVPNRHASIHGLIVYSSFWHSLNVIFMTDYAFQIITAIKVRR